MNKKNVRKILDDERFDETPVEQTNVEVISFQHYLSPPRIALILDVDIDYVRDLLRSGELRGIKLGQHWRITPREFKLWEQTKNEIANARIEKIQLGKQNNGKSNPTP